MATGHGLLVLEWAYSDQWNSRQNCSHPYPRREGESTARNQESIASVPLSLLGKCTRKTVGM